MDEDTPDEIADNMNQADYLKEKHKEAFKEEVRLVCLKAKKEVESGNLKIQYPKDVAPVPIADSLSSTSLHPLEQQRDEEANQPIRGDELNNTEPASQIDSPRTDQGVEISPDQQLEAELGSPLTTSSNMEQSADASNVAKSYADIKGSSSQNLPRSPSGSSVASVGSVGSLSSSNIASRVGPTYIAKDAETILTNSLNNHFAGVASSQAASALQNPATSEMKAEKDTNGGEYSTISSSRIDPLSSAQDSGSHPSGDYSTTGGAVPIAVVPVTPPVLIPHVDVVAKDKNKRLNEMELDKQLTAILSHAQTNVNAEGPASEANLVGVPVAVIPVAIASSHENANITDPNVSLYVENTYDGNLVCPYPNPSVNENVSNANDKPVNNQPPVNSSDTAPNNVPPIVVALSPTGPTVALPVAVSSQPLPVEVHNVLNVNEAGEGHSDPNFLSDVESLPSHPDMHTHSGFDTAGAPAHHAIVQDSPVESARTEKLAADEQAVAPKGRFQVSKVQEDALKDSGSKSAAEQSAEIKNETNSSSGSNDSQVDKVEVSDAPKQKIGRFQITPAPLPTSESTEQKQNESVTCSNNSRREPEQVASLNSTLPPCDPQPRDSIPQTAVVSEANVDHVKVVNAAGASEQVNAVRVKSVEASEAPTPPFYPAQYVVPFSYQAYNHNLSANIPPGDHQKYPDTLNQAKYGQAFLPQTHLASRPGSNPEEVNEEVRQPSTTYSPLEANKRSRTLSNTSDRSLSSYMGKSYGSCCTFEYLNFYAIPSYGHRIQDNWKVFVEYEIILFPWPKA